MRNARTCDEYFLQAAVLFENASIFARRIGLIVFRSYGVGHFPHRILIVSSTGIHVILLVEVTRSLPIARLSSVEAILSACLVMTTTSSEEKEEDEVSLLRLRCDPGHSRSRGILRDFE